MRLLAIASHPIQYQVPIFRRLSRLLDGQFEVVFKDTDMGTGGFDPEFGIQVKWDTPVLEGYSHRALDSLSPIGSLKGFIETSRPAAILLTLSYTDPLTWQVLATAEALRIPILWRFEGNDEGTSQAGVKRLLRSHLLRFLYKKVAAFLSIGEACDRHLRNHGVDQARIFRSPYNVEDELFEKMHDDLSPSRDSLRAELALMAEDFAFIVVGKFIDRKNPLLAIRALARCADSRMKLIFVGTGPLEVEIRSACKRLLPESQYALVGFANQTQLARFYVAADAALLPSDFETWGLVVNEAQHFALPVIVSSNVGCRVDLVIPGETGWIFSAGDPDDLAHKMAFLAKNREASRLMGGRGHSLVQRYTTSTATQGICDALEKIRKAG